MSRFGLVLLSLFVVVGCGSSHSEDDGGLDGTVADGTILFDAMIDAGPPDSGPHDMGVDMHVAVCGDGHLDPGEECDDAHLTRDAGTASGCDATCHRTAYCGDGHVDPGEECDDSENFACDGCAPNCRVEECGNGVVDCGELCDGTPGCETTGANRCLVVTTCGNMTIDTGEQCDPTTTTMPASFDGDGCGADCLLEQDLVVDTLQLAGEGMGCDFSGDGVPDNAFATALGPAETLLNMQLANAVAMGNPIILLSLTGLNDTTATMDPDVRLAWLQGMDADADATNNLHGLGTFYAAMGSFDASGAPNTTFTAGIAAHVLSGGPEDVAINLGAIPIPLTFRQAHISGRLTAASMSVSDMSDGLLCGAIPVSTLAGLPNFLDMFPGAMMLPPCDDTVATATFGDVLLGGASILGLSIGGVQPDVDLDHDGLESYEIATGPRGTCQAVVTACIDGDGTRIAGHDCTSDHRMADGWSAGLGLTAVHGQILGIR